MKHNSIPLKPPCCNNTKTIDSCTDDTGKYLYVLIRSLNPNDLIDYWIDIDKTRLETETIPNYFERRRMEAEEDSDLLVVLPTERLYMLKLPSTMSKLVLMRLLKYRTEQTQHFDCGSQEAKIICIYGQLVKTYNFLDYCNIPEL